ncbi:uncharacterized protein LOC111048010 [Nilaparvata lugens]|uniref:uncharacterized protein LOC111048010 n=1 Tax=Nilaparvata lugens TaxID=108931 RepID=UPI00193CE4EA|nr:uncharacterized protein LOC111048010 [Nilaparvata lugens]
MAVYKFQACLFAILVYLCGAESIFRIIYPSPWAPMVSNSITYRSEDPTNLDNMQVAQFHSQDAAGRYVFGFNTPDQVRVEARSRDGKVRGSYSYVDPLGRTVKMEYWDNGNGFHMAASPKSEFNPYTPEVQAARDLHFRLYKQAAQAAAHIQADTLSDAFKGHDDRDSMNFNNFDDGKYQSSLAHDDGKYHGSPADDGKYQSSLEDEGKYHSSLEDEGKYHSSMEGDGKYHGNGEEEGKYHSSYEHTESADGQYLSVPSRNPHDDNEQYPYVYNESPTSPTKHSEMTSDGGYKYEGGDGGKYYDTPSEMPDNDDRDSVVVNSAEYQDSLSRSGKSSVRASTKSGTGEQSENSESPKDQQQVPVQVVPEVTATLVESSVGDNGFFYQFQHPVIPQLQPYTALNSPPESLHASIHGAIPIDAVHDSQVSPAQISQVQNHQLKPLFMIMPSKIPVVV